MNLLDALAAAHHLFALLGHTLTTEQQLFVSAHHRQLDAFLRSDVGRTAARAFVDAWRATSAAK